MIEIPHHRTETVTAPKTLVVGIGNAGTNLADSLTMQTLPVAKIIAANTDSHSLMSSVSHEKLVLGQSVTRGLGAGGDPEVGARAAEESMSDLRIHLEGYSIIVICAGLGGGTGSGAAPLIAKAAKESGAFVIALVTLPFSFEGRRRVRQAEDAVTALEQSTNAVICFENDQMSMITHAGAGVEDTFDKSDALLGHCMESLIRMLELPGLMRVSLSDLTSLLAGRNPRCLFGNGESDAENRAFEAVAKALKCPLLERGRLLSQSRTVLVHIAGPEDLSLAEVSVIMREIEKYTDSNARITMGVGTRHNAGRTITVSILGCLSEPGQAAPPDAVPAEQPEPEAETQPVQEAPSQRETARQPQPGERQKAAKPELDENGKKVRPKQEFLQFDAVNRGRFEKSEPTIVEGEDLDVPTFLRQKIKLK